MLGFELRTRDFAGARLAADVAAYALNVRAEEILDLRRGRAEVAFARQVAVYLCHVALDMSLSRIAFVFGRDRSTVAHACHTMEDRREEPHFDLWIGGLETMLRQSPASARGVTQRGKAL
jgi:hypothetical protein